jgi:hypothetical protein
MFFSISLLSLRAAQGVVVTRSCIAFGFILRLPAQGLRVGAEVFPLILY